MCCVFLCHSNAYSNHQGTCQPVTFPINLIILKGLVFCCAGCNCWKWVEGITHHGPNSRNRIGAISKPGGKGDPLGQIFIDQSDKLLWLSSS